MMTPEEAGNYLAAVLSRAVVGVAIPLLILGFMLGGLRAMLRHGTQHPDGFIAKLFQDDTGKPSSDRLVKMVAVSITSWMVSVVVFAEPQLLLEAMGMYMVGWGGVDLTKHWLNLRPTTIAASQTTAAPPPAQPGQQP